MTHLFCLIYFATCSLLPSFTPSPLPNNKSTTKENKNKKMETETETKTRKRSRKTNSSRKENKKPPEPPQVLMETDFHQYYYSLVESIPVPEPTWSTTAPAVLCAAVPEPADVLEFEWWLENDGGESFASAEAWWAGFLKSLDCKTAKGRENVAVVGSCVEAAAPSMDNGGSFPEDWLCFPAAEDHGDEPAA